MIHWLMVLHRYPPALGGSEAYAARLAQYAARQGDQVTIWTSTAQDLEAMWLPGYREFPAGVEGNNPRVLRFAPRRFPARRVLAKLLSLVGSPDFQAYWSPCSPICPGFWQSDGPETLDVVHALGLPYANPLAAAWRIARRRAVPFFLTPFLHWGDPTQPHDRLRRQYTQPVLRRILQGADRLFAQTATEAEILEAVGVPAERIVLQGLGVEPTEVQGGDRAAARERLGFGSNQFVLGHLANLSAIKGSDDACEAVIASPEEVHLVLAGPRLRGWRPPQHPRIHDLGLLTAAQRRDFYAMLDGFLFPSRTDSYGLVLLEAWANGIPVIVVRAGGPGALVRHGIDGWIVPVGDIPALTAAVARWWDDRSLAVAMGLAGQRRVLQEHTWPERLELVRTTFQNVPVREPQAGKDHSPWIL